MKKQMLPQERLLWADAEAFLVSRPLFFLSRDVFSSQRPYRWTLAVAWSWTRAHVGTITSAGTTTSRPTPAPSSGTEAATATRTASTRRRSARGRVWWADQQVHSHESSPPYELHLCHSHLACQAANLSLLPLFLGCMQFPQPKWGQKNFIGSKCFWLFSCVFSLQEAEWRHLPYICCRYFKEGQLSTNYSS